MQPVDYISGLLSVPLDPLGAINKQIGFEGDLRAQEMDTAYKGAQIQQAQAEQQAERGYAQAMQAYLANPTQEGLATLLGQFPKQREATKAAFEALDAPRRQSELTQLGSIGTMLANGNDAGAVQMIEQRMAADAAARTPDPMDALILKALQSGDPSQRKVAAGLVATAIGTLVGPEHASPLLKSLNLDQIRDVRETGGVVWDGRDASVIGLLPGGDQKVVPGVGIFQVSPAGVPLIPLAGSAPTDTGAPYYPTNEDPAAAAAPTVVPPAPGGVEPSAFNFYSKLKVVPGGERGAPRPYGAHNGVDLSGLRVGTPIPTPWSAKLVDSGSDGGSGNWGKWELPNNYVISVSHLAQKPTLGQVAAGGSLGIAGNTGRTSNRGTNRAVLHIRAWDPNGKEIDARSLLNGPKRVRSVQEYAKVRSGELYMDPNGKMKVKQ